MLQLQVQLQVQVQDLILIMTVIEWVTQSQSDKPQNPVYTLQTTQHSTVSTKSSLRLILVLKLLLFLQSDQKNQTRSSVLASRLVSS